MQKEKKVQWAILGAGKIAHKFAQDFSATSNGEIVAVASRDLIKGRAFADQYNIPKVLTYNDLYNNGNIDVVYIATPHNFHYSQSLSCLNNGKSVLCEKPVTINDIELKHLVSVAREKKLFFMEALWTYFLPSIIKAREWLQVGKIGNLKLIQADFAFAMEFNPEGRLFNPLLAGGALLDLGVYLVAFSTYFLGRRPEAIKALGHLGRTNIDESVSMIFQSADVICSLTASIVTRGTNKGFLFGTNGYIVCPDFYKTFSAELYSGDHKLLESFKDDRSTWGYNYQIQHVTDCLLNGILESNIVSHSKSLEIQEIMTLVRRQIGLVYPMEAVSQEK
jgi:dihydrodiol dehydrogenase / D-xylose 1-dehydrogenase (NADP)